MYSINLNTLVKTESKMMYANMNVNAKKFFPGAKAPEGNRFNIFK